MVALGVVLAMGQPALAATSLCVETHSSGYNWVNDAWVPVNFNTESYIMKELAPDDPMAANCQGRMVAGGYATTVAPGSFLATASGCYAAYAVGEEPSENDVTMCLEIYNDAVLFVVSCVNEGIYRFEFEPSGEFTMNRMYATRMSRSTNESRDSLVLSVGKCSVIEP